jgi:hypothetical protein
MGQKLDDPDSFVPATGTNFIGHVTRDVTTDGPTLEDRVFGRTSTTPVPLNEPFKAGNEVTVRQHEEIEVEGTDLVQTSGTGGITAITTPGTKLSLNAGRFYQAQTGDHVFYLLTANNLPDTTGGTTRIRVQRT